MIKKNKLLIYAITFMIFTISIKLEKNFAAESNVPPVQTESVLFRFNDNAGDIYTIKGISTLKFYMNNHLRQNAVSHWESLQKAMGQTNTGMKFSFSYKSTRQGNETANTSSEFIRKSTGEMLVNSESFFPQSVSVPTFPAEPVKVGHSWESAGEEVIDFRKLGTSEPFRLKFHARYVFKGFESVNGKRLAVIHVFYVVNDNRQRRIYTPVFGRTGGEGSYLPARLMGYFERHFYWDMEQNYWKKMDASINFILTFTGGVTVEWESRVKSEMIKSR